MPGNTPKELVVLDSKISHLLATIYGPYAFGFIALMVMWTYIVGPQLELQRVDYNKNQVIVDNMRDLMSTQKEVSQALERTTTNQIVISETLLKAVSELSNVSKIQ